MRSIILILLSISYGIGNPTIEPGSDFFLKISSPNVSVEIGHSFTLNCTLETPTWEHRTATTWLKNNKHMKVSDNLIQTVKKLKIKQSSAEDAGNYTCIRCNTYTCKHGYFMVNVIQPAQGLPKA